MLGSFADERPVGARASSCVDTLVHIWVSSIYGDSRLSSSDA